jgi:hypothetical protein
MRYSPERHATGATKGKPQRHKEHEGGLGASREAHPFSLASFVEPIFSLVFI